MFKLLLVVVEPQNISWTRCVCSMIYGWFNWNLYNNFGSKYHNQNSEDLIDFHAFSTSALIGLSFGAISKRFSLFFVCPCEIPPWIYHTIIRCVPLLSCVSDAHLAFGLSGAREITKSPVVRISVSCCCTWLVPYVHVTWSSLAVCARHVTQRHLGSPCHWVAHGHFSTAGRISKHPTNNVSI